MSARPIVKWAGGKTRLVPDIWKHLPFHPEHGELEIGTYVEPFAGGGALFFALSERLQRARLADVNKDLIGFYTVVKTDAERLIEVLKFGIPDHPKFVYCKKNFLDWRAKDPKELSPIVRAARFLFLNRTCFNGLYRVNRRGQFNVPFGRYTNPTIVDEEGIRNASKALENVSLSASDYEEAIRGLDSGDLVYFDPPYDPVSETANFTSYAEGGFGWKEQERLAEVATCLRIAGVKVIASNADTPRIRELWTRAGFVLHEVKAARAINSSGEKRGKVSELVMVSR